MVKEPSRVKQLSLYYTYTCVIVANVWSLEKIFGFKILKFFYADPDPGSGIFLGAAVQSPITLLTREGCWGVPVL
jgi:hypothetical protein